MSDSLYGRFRTNTFGDIYPEAEQFVEEMQINSNISVLSNKSLYILHALLMSRYKNWSIANADENNFKDKLRSIIFMYGPTWEKRLDIQNKLIKLTDDEVMTGSVQIYNHSYDPGTAPSTLDTEELNTVNDQNVNKFKRGKLEGYETLYSIIKFDVSKEFIDKFKKLFNPFCQPQLPLIYTIEED